MSAKVQTSQRIYPAFITLNFPQKIVSSFDYILSEYLSIASTWYASWINQKFASNIIIAYIAFKKILNGALERAYLFDHV